MFQKSLIYGMYFGATVFFGAPICILATSVQNKIKKNTQPHSVLPIVDVHRSKLNYNKAVLETEAEDSMALLSLGYPRAKSTDLFYLYINRKLVATVKPGERYIVQLKQEASYRVCVGDSKVYHEPRTQAPNSRTLTIKLGHRYYFSINKGKLEYAFIASNGAKEFNNNADYRDAAPIVLTPNETGEIPTL